VWWSSCATGAPALAGGEIYGTIHLHDGTALTGPIRWDVNENFWDDELNASQRESVKKEDEGYKIRLFGMKLGGSTSYVTHAFSIERGEKRLADTRTMRKFTASKIRYKLN